MTGKEESLDFGLLAQRRKNLKNLLCTVLHRCVVKIKVKVKFAYGCGDLKVQGIFTERKPLFCSALIIFN